MNQQTGRTTASGVDHRLARGAVALLVLSLFQIHAANLRPPAVPLVTHDPYFSIWSPADKLSDAETIHWTGKRHRLSSEVSIDGKTFRLMGKEPVSISALPQKNVEVFPTRTVYTFAGEGLSVRLTFLTPALPDDLMVCSRPVTYLTWDFEATDGREHEVSLGFQVSGEPAVNVPTQEVVSMTQAQDDLVTVIVGSKEQPVLAKKGDDLRIDWGYFLVSVRKTDVSSLELATVAGGERKLLQKGFASRQELMNPVPADSFRASLDFKVGKVGDKPVSRQVMLGYDDQWSIKYFREKLRPYWRRDGADSAALMKLAASDYERLRDRCERFDSDLMDDLRKVGGPKYAELCALAYRQTFAGNKIVADANGKPLMFPKENFSNGCIGTVDVLFPQAPFFLAFSPALTKAMLVPILEYAASPRWPYDYAPHDLGTYPQANGQVYGMGGKDGDRMPVEESGNMLIILAALARQEHSVELATNYWTMLKRWADYLVNEGLDPQNQLCSADMFGHLPRNANLALKAIIGIGGFAQLCEMAGKTEDAKAYAAIARDYAAKWQELAKGDGRTILAYGQPNTWAMKHNLIWDRVLGLNLFPASLGDAEIAWYLKVQKQYGLPVDNRTDQSLIDWALWSIAPARTSADFQALLEPIWRYVNETPSRVPLSDWFVTTDAKQKGFQARPVVGGIFIKLIADPSTWNKWAKRGANAHGPWAPIQVGAAPKEVVPTARAAQAMWRYTLRQPASDWTKPGFDDSAWKEGPGGFGTEGTPGAVIGTKWNTTNIWLRREFTLPERPLKQPRLLLIYDEDPEVYLNGVLAAKLTGWITEYDEVEIAPGALNALHPGKNVLAVRASQTYGGQCIDAGLAEEGDETRMSDKERGSKTLPGLRRLFEFPVRDTCICVGPDRAYYLTGTTGHPTWWTRNEGIRIWRSPNLTNWTPLGLVWTFEKDSTWQKRVKADRRAVWAPELHFIKGTFWLTYCMNWEGGGTGLLKSTSGKAEGPYVDVKPDGPLTQEIDASLFQEDNGQVYFVFQNGKIARMKEDMSGLAEEPRLLKPANSSQVGFEGAFLTKVQGRYQLVCAEFNKRDGISAYDCMVASADNVYGPYGERYLALPHAGHNMLFKDLNGQWWATFFGNDPRAPWREQPGIIPIRIDSDGKVVPAAAHTP